ncbi:phenylalanine 4-monooxygenase [Legionella parisiensis]|uniref:Phenylalanine-4-hydroxylase n=1 Tax=Legionella parisiensis TaxID=45071 RepID=A0A1E5JVQ2_9GAMM|nr:phenylalanine 4-monooxygenase [Legionella parisiensis]KTD40148.1 phenylalanine-4-hydroxylase [Legionella parisiensis]OEH48607.1 Phenylalanine-4-hydroxylase [Legionella parisiensis]STX77307.1 phenylalanine-4-hydroxylase [Legionella parisiensis]
MEFSSRYVAHDPDAQGFVNYSAEENRIWNILFQRQIKLIPGRACDEFILGLKTLGIKSEGIPQIPELNKKLEAETGWQVSAVAALISAREFFELLAKKHFPVATFIRNGEELDYVKEPDIFHEVFGHCPMLTDRVYAEFVYDYARKVLTFPESDWPLLQRMFWFTVEFGLIKSPKGLRAYGGGILSSISETVYSVESDIPLRVIFDPVAAFRMPYRIDMLQPVYFVISDYQVLYDFVLSDIGKLLARTRELGEFPPFFKVDPNNPNIHIRAC